jgi:hypothetical protein
MTTFVVAALVLAVLFADRLGPPGELRRRLYQVALAVAVVLAVLAFAALVRPSPSAGVVRVTSPDDTEQTREVARVLRERTIVIVGSALLIVLVSLNYVQLLPTTHTGTLLGGLVLIVISVSDPNFSSQILPFYLEALAEVGTLRYGVFFGVTGLGTLYLLQYGYRQWDRQDVESLTEQEPVG